MQVYQAIHSGEGENPYQLVSTNFKRPQFLTHESPCHHSPWFKMRQYFHHWNNWPTETWRPGSGHLQKGFLCKECHRYVCLWSWTLCFLNFFCFLLCVPNFVMISASGLLDAVWRFGICYCLNFVDFSLFNLLYSSIFFQV